MRPIGGYFGLETGPTIKSQDSSGYLSLQLRSPAVAVNFGRGGLELIVRTRNYCKVWIPDYICPVVPEYLCKLGIAYKTYEIDANLEPVSIPTLAPHEAFLYVNYFGVKDAYCRKLEQQFSMPSPSLILDLTQAFYYVPIRVDGFNSARKFFGVPDGGFVFGKGLSDASLPESMSYDRCGPLLHRADGDISGGYSIFLKLDESMHKLSVAKMSQLTRMLLASIDQSSAASRRQSNFNILQKSLGSTNRFSFEFQVIGNSAFPSVPLIYPYLVRNGSELRNRLIASSIFCPTYWSHIMAPGPVASNFITNLVCIPIDQRYTEDDMNLILEFLHG